MQYPAGADWSWIAVDNGGRVALFVTAGVAPIPLLILDGYGEDKIDIERDLMNLPIISQGDLDNGEEWYREYVARGIFVYDWSDVHRADGHLNTYQRVGAPNTAIDINDFPNPLNFIAKLAIFAETSFASSPFIDVSNFFAVDEG